MNSTEPLVKQSTYDYSRLIAAAKEEAQYSSFSAFIDEKIHDCRRKYYNGTASLFNRSTLAKIIGIDTSTLTKIINHSQGTRKRDLIIALCFALQLSYVETNQALNLYPMAPLNDKNLRDLVISHALQDHASVAELNDILKSHRFPQLNIQRGQRDEERGFYFPLGKTAFEEISTSVIPYRISSNDSDLSLHERYRPDMFDYQSEMIIRRKGNGNDIYRISLNNYHYVISRQVGNEWEPYFSDEHIEQEIYKIKRCDDAGLLDEITKLKEYTDCKARYIHSMCNDTRYYGSRFDAKNDHGTLLIYGETFGFGMPELCEYFQIQISSTECLFTVSNSSRFLNQYLGKECWMNLYLKTLPPIIATFTSLEEVTCIRWHEQFQKLMRSARNLLNQIRERKLFLFNAHATLDIDELMHIFHADTAFECYQPDDLPYCIPGKDQIIGPDGKPITVDDLYRAAELDIFTIEDLCAIRTRYGTLDGFVTIDALNERKGQDND